MSDFVKAKAGDIVRDKKSKRYLLNGYDDVEDRWILAEIKEGLSIESLKDSLASDLEVSNKYLNTHFLLEK